MAGREAHAIASALNEHGGHGLLLHSDGSRSLIVLEDFLDVRCPVAAAGINAIESLRIFAGPVINLQTGVSGGEDVRNRASLHFGLDFLCGFERLMRKFEAMIAKRVHARSDLLAFDPGRNAPRI